MLLAVVRPGKLACFIFHSHLVHHSHPFGLGNDGHTVFSCGGQFRCSHFVSGHKNIRKWVDDYFKAFKTRWKKVPTKNFVLGEYGFDEGHDTAIDTPRGGGKPTHYDCKGILIYKRQANGEWRIFRDIWNNNKPPRTGK